MSSWLAGFITGAPPKRLMLGWPGVTLIRSCAPDLTTNMATTPAKNGKALRRADVVRCEIKLDRVSTIGVSRFLIEGYIATTLSSGARTGLRLASHKTILLREARIKTRILR